MPFPRAKGIEYEISNHMPLAIMWPDRIRKPGRVVTDYVSFIDFAPTFLELAGVADPVAAGMQPITGRSLLPILESDKAGRVVAERDHVLLGQERHDVGRPGDVGYPVRSIIRNGMLYQHVFEPDRWPMGNPETGYLNTDGSPTKTVILDMRRKGGDRRFWDLCFGKRGREELYDLRTDPDCLVDLMANQGSAGLASELKAELFKKLKEQGDPRMFGKGEIFDRYPYAGSAQRDFYSRYMAGKINGWVTGWVNKSDFEREPIKE
jgi:arylsulfatase A-like enzyme